jgi:hypothetical protein
MRSFRPSAQYEKCAHKRASHESGAIRTTTGVPFAENTAMPEPKTCPVCGLLNPPEAQRCDCGWDFADRLVERSYANPQDPTNIAELGMTLKQVGRRNITLGLGSVAAGIVLLTLTFGSPVPMCIAFGLASTGFGMIVRGIQQRRPRSAQFAENNGR